MTVNNCLVSESQYLPPVSWFIQSHTYPCIILNEGEKFVKATTRNRCHIAGSNGLIRLSIPLAKGRDQKIQMKDVRVDNDSNWQKNHWQSIRSAYGRAPFFIYYNDVFEKVFESHFESLVDFNYELLTVCYKSLGIKKEIKRDMNVSPDEKTSPPAIELLPYQQVFAERLGFVPNLSIIDLLFNLGPDAKGYIEKIAQRSFTL